MLFLQIKIIKTSILNIQECYYSWTYIHILRSSSHPILLITVTNNYFNRKCEQNIDAELAVLLK